MYTRLMPQLPRADWKAIAIHPRIHPRYRFFVRLAVHKRLATVDRLIKFGIQFPPDRAYCGLTLETFGHLFFECQATKELWNRLCIWLGFSRAIQDWETEVI
ncbi:hypothetical protein RDI58_026680 [Solanum bulbocastanum]|uniref:Reverse transcriptase zinc-binding domain-containing protein n=1 Tax=Solanum bulbocastanum TaxID=147425 RepID=A0AAN8SU92_SOLBU